MRKRKKATSMRKRKNKARSEQNLSETDTIIRSVDNDIEKVEPMIILQRKTLLKNSKDFL
jgi:glutaredoxin 2